MPGSPQTQNEDTTKGAAGLSDLSAQELGNHRGVGLISWGPRPSRGKVLEPSASRRCIQTWAMLIKRVYEIDPLSSPECGGQMKVIAFIEPPQGEVIETILRHGGL